jgi:hypothetical protein
VAAPSPSPSPTPGPPLGWGLVPVEVRRRNPQLEDMWTTVYWITFVLTYVVIPVVQEYVAAGEFTKRGRLIASFKINIIFYAVCGLVAFGALAYVVIGLNQGLSDLQPVLISLANSMGLVIMILLLGYGAAEVPRAVWNESDAAGELRRLYFRAPELDSQVFDARGTVADLLKRIRDFEAQVAAMAADKGLAEKALVALTEGWLAPGAIVAVEERADVTVAPPAGFTALDHRVYGETQVLLLRFDGR